MTRIIAIALQKGGVGKTTTSQHLAHALALMGRKVLLVDLDSQASTTNRYDQEFIRGTLSQVLGGRGDPTKKLKDIVSPTYVENLFLVAANEELATTDNRMRLEPNPDFRLDILFRQQSLPFDYVIFDTAPGKSQLQKAALVAADEIVVPVQLSPMGFEGFKAIDATIAEARESQRIQGQVRLRYRAVLPTFYSALENISQAFYSILQEAEHPDYAGEPLPLAPMPVPETTAFEQVSASVLFDDGIRRARSIFELASGGDNTPIERGQMAYMKLAEYVDSYVS